MFASAVDFANLEKRVKSCEETDSKQDKLLDNHEERIKNLEARIKAIDDLEAKIKSMSSLPRIEPKGDGGAAISADINLRLAQMQAEIGDNTSQISQIVNENRATKEEQGRMRDDIEKLK